MNCFRYFVFHGFTLWFNHILIHFTWKGMGRAQMLCWSPLPFSLFPHVSLYILKHFQYPYPWPELAPSMNKTPSRGHACKCTQWSLHYKISLLSTLGHLSSVICTNNSFFFLCRPIWYVAKYLALTCCPIPLIFVHFVFNVLTFDACLNPFALWLMTAFAHAD